MMSIFRLLLLTLRFGKRQNKQTNIRYEMELFCKSSALSSCEIDDEVMTFELQFP